MLIKGFVEEDFANYKKASMFISFPHCTFKCEKESGCRCCQNSGLASAETIDVSGDEIINRYMSNPITSAIVIGGLEPFDDWGDLYGFIVKLRSKTLDDVVVYTGYNKDEIEGKLSFLKDCGNIVVKFGRYIPNSQHRYDEILGVELASDNQYAERL